MGLSKKTRGGTSGVQRNHPAGCGMSLGLGARQPTQNGLFYRDKGAMPEEGWGGTAH